MAAQQRKGGVVLRRGAATLPVDSVAWHLYNYGFAPAAHAAIVASTASVPEI
jgi:hypothetical protein